MAVDLLAAQFHQDRSKKNHGTVHPAGRDMVERRNVDLQRSRDVCFGERVLEEGRRKWDWFASEMTVLVRGKARISWQEQSNGVKVNYRGILWQREGGQNISLSLMVFLSDSQFDTEWYKSCLRSKSSYIYILFWDP
jgi:hypothetical protein